MERLILFVLFLKVISCSAQDINNHFDLNINDSVQLNEIRLDNFQIEKLNSSLNKFTTMLVGTGDTPTILSFYESCGFEKSHFIKNFFTDNYDHPMFEDGIQLIDMIYLKKKL